MIKKNQGYGICGMKNIYSSSSLLGNWVEDNFGRDLVEMKRSSKRSFDTEYSQNHIDPGTMVSKSKHLPEVKLESVEVLKAKNKEGMPYSLLFGAADEAHEDFYRSTAHLAQINDDSGRFTLPEHTLERTKARNRLKEKDAAFRKTTETRALNSHQLPGDGVPHMSVGSTAELPSFNRTKPRKVEGLVIKAANEKKAREAAKLAELAAKIEAEAEAMSASHISSTA